MALIFDSNRIPSGLHPEVQQSLYNGLDGLITRELLDILTPITGRSDHTYAFERNLLGPVLTMVRRGILIDREGKEKMIGGDPLSNDASLKAGLLARTYALSGMERIVRKGKATWKITNEDASLQRLAKVVWGKTINCHSDKQLKEFFYTALQIPSIAVVKKGERKISCDREALERMRSSYVRAMPFCSIILRIRDLEKQVDVLSKNLSPTHRWAASYNIGGTNTGRWSSSDNPLRHSANAQNISNDLRRVFVPDPGYVMVQCDQQGAESRGVAYLSGDPNYIKAVESGDVHTTVAAMCWKFEPLRELADRICYRDYSYRFMAKKLGHGRNYGGQPRTLGQQTKVETKVTEEFCNLYDKAFPGIVEWRRWVASEVQSKGLLITPFGRRRQFWDRLKDDTTIRGALAFVPQSLIGDLTALSIYNLWLLHEPRAQLLANGHDAVLWQCKIEDLPHLYPQVMKMLEVKIPVADINGKERTLTIPFEAKLGFNWANQDENNPQGLMSPSKFTEKYGVML